MQYIYTYIYIPCTYRYGHIHKYLHIQYIYIYMICVSILRDAMARHGTQARHENARHGKVCKLVLLTNRRSVGEEPRWELRLCTRSSRESVTFYFRIRIFIEFRSNTTRGPRFVCFSRCVPKQRSNCYCPGRSHILHIPSL